MADRARSVRLDEAALADYAATLAAASEPDPSTHFAEADPEARAAFVVCLGAINFGSGWWPTIRKRPGQSGYGTIAAGVTERFRERGAWAAAELSELTPAEIAAVVGQDLGHPLLDDFAAALRDVGQRVRDEHGGSFLALPGAAGGSAPALAGLLAEWRAFGDASSYEGRPVPFFKRAQLVAADLDRFVTPLAAVDRLTAFADNLVPHVLRVDGLLGLDPQLAARIEAGELLEHGSPEEVELRACAVHAVELLAGAGGLTPAEVDLALWTRGAQPRCKALPRPRCRNTAY
ncbi:MAG TPA: queuosine salvage family protein [Solirubrobacterales bacterium]|nr:queuosine salvage family protein [Solirubrobacterales bacterium]